jgi:hypothetical protein
MHIIDHYHHILISLSLSISLLAFRWLFETDPKRPSVSGYGADPASQKFPIENSFRARVISTNLRPDKQTWQVVMPRARYQPTT